MNCESEKVNPKLLLCGAFGHLLCWLGGDLLLYFLPNGRLDVMGLFDYEKTVTMLQGASPLQFTISGILGVIAMMVIMPGYFQIANILKPASMKSAKVVQVGIALTCVAGAVMHFTCTGMLWHFVKAGATKQAHEIMLSYFWETSVTSAMCNIGVFMVCVTLFIAVIRRKTCLPKWACLVNTIFFTMVAGIVFAGMGAMNVGSSLMFLGLFFLMRKHNYGVHMTIDTNTMVSITEANQNFSKVARLVDELGSVVILKNNAPRYLVIDFSKADESAVAKDEDVLEVSKRLLAQNKEAYEVLAK